MALVALQVLREAVMAAELEMAAEGPVRQTYLVAVKLKLALGQKAPSVLLLEPALLGRQEPKVQELATAALEALLLRKPAEGEELPAFGRLPLLQQHLRRPSQLLWQPAPCSPLAVSAHPPASAAFAVALLHGLPLSPPGLLLTPPWLLLLQLQLHLPRVTGASAGLLSEAPPSFLRSASPWHPCRSSEGCSQDNSHHFPLSAEAGQLESLQQLLGRHPALKA